MTGLKLCYGLVKFSSLLKLNLIFCVRYMAYIMDTNEEERSKVCIVLLDCVFDSLRSFGGW